MDGIGARVVETLCTGAAARRALPLALAAPRRPGTIAQSACDIDAPSSSASDARALRSSSAAVLSRDERLPRDELLLPAVHAAHVSPTLLCLL